MDINSLLELGVVGALIAFMVFLVRMNWKREVMHNETINNHLKHLTESMTKFSANLKDSISTNKYLGNVMERVERILDRDK